MGIFISLEGFVPEFTSDPRLNFTTFCFFLSLFFLLGRLDFTNWPLSFDSKSVSIPKQYYSQIECPSNSSSSTSTGPLWTKIPTDGYSKSSLPSWGDCCKAESLLELVCNVPPTSCKSHPWLSGHTKKGNWRFWTFFSIISSNDTMKDLYKKGFKKEDVLEALRILPFVSVSNLCFGCQRISMEILGRPKLIASCLKSTLPWSEQSPLSSNVLRRPRSCVSRTLTRSTSVLSSR